MGRDGAAPGVGGDAQFDAGLLDQFRSDKYERYACPIVPASARSRTERRGPAVELMLRVSGGPSGTEPGDDGDAGGRRTGRSDPARMADAFETCLRSANHMEQGTR